MQPSGAGEIWAQLSATLKALRIASGMSLRGVEVRSGVGRGTLSAIENGKARPGRGVVEWYDEMFGGDGLPLSMYAEARTAHTLPRLALPHAALPPAVPVPLVPGCAHEDVVRAEVLDPATGALVRPGVQVRARWRLRNEGLTAWTGRTARRVGVPAAPGLILSDAVEPVPDVGPGEVIEFQVTVRIPDEPGTVAAYWQLAHADGSPCGARGSMLRLIVVASPLCDA